MSKPPPAFTTNCRRCPRLAEHLRAVRADHPDYHARPVASFGAPGSRLLVVGLAPGMHGANATGRPFTGDHAGLLLYKTLHEYGFSNQPVSERLGDGLELSDCRITNAVRCLPPENKPTTEEVRTCNGYLHDELVGLASGSVVLALGRIAHDAILRACAQPLVRYPFAHGARHRLAELGVRLLDSYHCSRYNTQTGRLTPAMFRRVLREARTLINRSGAG